MTETAPQHAKYSASGSAKRLNCSGSYAMEQGIPEVYRAYSDEGSAAHFLGADCLTKKKSPFDYLGKVIVCWADKGMSRQSFLEDGIPLEAVERSRWQVTSDMAENVQVYVDLVNDLAKGGNVLFIEQRVNFGKAFDRPQEFGTADTIILVVGDEEFIVVDYKHGFSFVDAEKNSQLMDYGLGVLVDFEEWLNAETLVQARFIICQPRINNISEWVCPINELLAFAETERKAIERSEEALAEFNRLAGLKERSFTEELAWQDKYLSPTEKGCQWCKAKANCPAVWKDSLEGITLPAATVDTLDNLDDELDAAIQRVCTMDFNSVAKAFGAVKKIEKWLEAVEARMLLEMLQGEKHPDWKLVKGRAGNRKWKNDLDAEDLLKASRKVRKEEMYTMELISPTSAEKLWAKKNPALWGKLNELVIRSDPKIQVAARDDKREPVDPYGDNLALLPQMDFLDVVDDIDF